MGKKSNMGQSAGIFGGLVNAGAGKHAYKETGRNDSGRKTTGYGSDSKKANSDYKKKGGR